MARLPKEVGVAVERVGRMRRMAKSEAPREEEGSDRGVGTNHMHDPHDDEDEFDENTRLTTPNLPVPSRSPPIHDISAMPNETEAESARRKIKWVAQVSEYWSIPKLAQMSDAEMADILSGELYSSVKIGRASCRERVCLAV